MELSFIRRDSFEINLSFLPGVFIKIQINPTTLMVVIYHNFNHSEKNVYFYQGEMIDWNSGLQNCFLSF